MQTIVMADHGHGPATRLAVQSFRRHHPDAAVTVVVTDPTGHHVDLGADVSVLHAADLAVCGLRYIDVWLCGGPEFARWAAVPAAVRAVGGDATTLVLPGNAWVLAPLDDLWATVPDDRIGLLASGFDATSGVAFDGFVPDVAVIGAAASATLAWWEAAARTRLLDAEGSDPSASPWSAFISGGPLTILHDPTVRVSPTSARHLDLDDPSATTDPSETTAGPGGLAVRLAQFPGFDPHRPWWYSPSPELDPQVLTSESPTLRRLCLDYAAALGPAGPPPGSGTPRPTTSGLVGLDHSPELRSLLRATFRTALRDGTAFANPLDPATATEFFEWMRDPAASTVTGISPAADVVWARRPDIAAAFPHVRWNDRDRAVRWLWTHGLQEGLIPASLLPPRPLVEEPEPERPTPTTAVRPRFGVNLVGYHDSELGLGVAVRRVGAALDAAGIDWAKVTYDRSHSRRRGISANTADAPYWFNLVLVAPDQLSFFADDVGAAFFEDHYNIGLWYWETDTMRQRQIDAFALVDEVWGSTRYLADVFARYSPGPVAHIPVPLEFADTTADPATRARLGIDDRFTFLFSFDFLSISQRKNPLDLVTAYRDAFDATEGCRLILKSINGDRHIAEAEELRAAFADRHDIELWDRYLDGNDRIDLVANVDCYVSLHRSEGLGLTMAEAMSAGTPVIATGYSGNVDFMPEGSALLVDHRIVEIGPGSFYPADGHWAQPDLAQAAALMRTVRDDAELRDRLRLAGPAALRPFTTKRVGAAIAARLHELWR